MKRIIFLLMLLLVPIMCVGCEKAPEEKIVGYWVSSDLYSSVSFDEKGTVVVDDKYIGEYSVFDDNKVAINVDTAMFDEFYDISMSGEFIIENEILHITDLENRCTYRFYSKEKAETLVNEEFWTLSARYTPEQYLPETISYSDEWELFLDGTPLEGITSKQQLEKGSVEAVKIVEDKVLPLYENSILEGEYSFVCTCDSAVYVMGKVCYRVNIWAENVVGTIKTFVVDISQGYIFEEDLDGLINIWDGKIKGRSLLEEI